MDNIVEIITGDDKQSFNQSCKYGNLVEGHAVYCHNQEWADAPRKCRRTWYTGGIERDEDCPGYSPNPNQRNQRGTEMDEIVIGPETSFERPIHPEGQFAAVCVDIIDLGTRVETFNGKTKTARKLVLVFHTGEQNPDFNRPFDLSEEMTVSMHERARLRQFLEKWRGKKFTDEELAKSFTMTGVLGRSALINVEHRSSKKGGSYANIGSIMPLPKGMETPKLPEYKRAPFWAQRKERYADELAAWESRPQEGEETPF